MSRELLTMLATNQPELRKLESHRGRDKGRVLTEYGFMVLLRVLDRAALDSATGRYLFFEGLDKTSDYLQIGKSNVADKLAALCEVGLLIDRGMQKNGRYRPTKTYEVNVELLAGTEYARGRTYESGESTPVGTPVSTPESTPVGTPVGTPTNAPEPYVEPTSLRNPNPNPNGNPNPRERAETLLAALAPHAASSPGGVKSKSKSNEPWPEREESVIQEVLKRESASTTVRNAGAFERTLRADYWPIISRLCHELAPRFEREPDYAHKYIADRAYEDRQQTRKRSAS